MSRPSLSDKMYETFVGSADWLEGKARAELLTTSKGERTVAYRLAAALTRYNEFQREIGEYRLFILTSTLYLRPEFEPMLLEIDDLAGKVMDDFRLQIGGDETVKFESAGKLLREGKPILNKLKEATRDRLWSSASLALDERLGDPIRKVVGNG